jgi:hypothetical protein
MNSIKCPQCNTEIDVNEVLSHKLDTEYKQKYVLAMEQEKQKYSQQFKTLEQEKLEINNLKENLQNEINIATSKKLAIERIKLKEQIKQQIQLEQSGLIASLQAELNQKSQQVKELNDSKAEIERLKREKNELESSIRAKAEQDFNQLLKAEQERIQKQAIESVDMKIREKDNQLDALRNQLREAQRKAEQGSMQLQGEVQELAIEQWLIEKFPFDTIEEIKKGQRGADCIQIVHTREIQNCGKIYYESKRTKDFSNSWIEKFKADMRDKNADVGVLITEVYPKGMERLGLFEGVWICSYDEFKGIVPLLREQIIKIYLAMRSQENKADKMHLLYGYLTSNEFKMQVEAIVEGFSQMKSDLDSEKRAMNKIWKQREKQIEKVIDNTVNMYGAIKGIAGNAIADIKYIELPVHADMLSNNSQES